MKSKQIISTFLSCIMIFSILTVSTIMASAEGNNIRSSGEPELPDDYISLDKFWEAIDGGIKGQIWITKDSTNLGVNHGHVALLYGYTRYYVAFIEHPGANAETSSEDEKGLSGIIEWENYDGQNSTRPPWSTVKTLRVYNVATPESISRGEPFDLITMICAADYAAAYLCGIEYAIMPLKNSSKWVNCATLVYQAYANASTFGGNSIKLGNPLSTTVLPRDLLEDEHLILDYSAQWDGDSHEWNEEVGG